MLAYAVDHLHFILPIRLHHRRCAEWSGMKLSKLELLGKTWGEILASTLGRKPISSASDL